MTASSNVSSCPPGTSNSELPARHRHPLGAPPPRATSSGHRMAGGSTNRRPASQRRHHRRSRTQHRPSARPPPGVRPRTRRLARQGAHLVRRSRARGGHRGCPALGPAHPSPRTRKCRPTHRCYRTRTRSHCRDTQHPPLRAHRCSGHQPLRPVVGTSERRPSKLRRHHRRHEHCQQIRLGVRGYRAVGHFGVLIAGRSTSTACTIAAASASAWSASGNAWWCRGVPHVLCMAQRCRHPLPPTGVKAGKRPCRG